MKIYLPLLFFLAFNCIWAQEQIWISFHPATNQHLGFDAPKSGVAKNLYPNFSLPNGKLAQSSFKLMAYGKSDYVNFQVHGDSTLDISKIEFFFGKEKLKIQQIENSLTLQIKYPKVSNDILAYRNGKIIGRLKTKVLHEKKKKVVLVPIITSKMNKSELEAIITPIFKQANITLQIEVQPIFQSKVFNSNAIFTSPDSLKNRYSGQMRLLRDVYFKANPEADRNAFYLFVIPGFSNGSPFGFMVNDKAIGFVPYQIGSHSLGIQIARTLAFGMGGLNTDWFREVNLPTKNLMDTTFGKDLTHFQITELQRNFSIYARIDEYENVKTGNGTIAYYFWEEDDDGNVIVDGKSLVAVPRQPFKKNFLAYKFDVKYAIMRPLFRIGKYYISLLNFTFVGILILLIFFFRKKSKIIWLKMKWQNYSRIFLFWTLFVLFLFLLFESFSWGNAILDKFKKVSGPMPVLKDLTYREARNELFTNPEIRKQGEANLFSEILIRKNKAWEVKKRGQVLYFEIQEKGKSLSPIVRFVSSNDSLILEKDSIRAFARTHYIVYSFKNHQGEIIKQEAYSYDGKKMEQFLQQTNVPRRILVFTNGYRPTSTGQSVGEGFKNIQTNGLEYPNSSNFIYNFDRYNYWQPWGEINLQFQNRINPSLTYYADGHFSVSTSDYQSLLNFTRISQIYPFRCKNHKKHVCHKMKNDQLTRFFMPTTKTEKLLKLNSNTNGFAYRKKKGKIAGMNLLQELNTYPNQSENDTLFIVAHSMGFAYSLGMIEVLRNKINFGGFYIIAPENAKSGKVNPKEWQQIWQYGSRFNVKNPDAPCLQDGVAPQSNVKGLPFKNRVFIPKQMYSRRGFFDSHFIGYYDWVLKLETGKTGNIQQR